MRNFHLTRIAVNLLLIVALTIQPVAVCLGSVVGVSGCSETGAFTCGGTGSSWTGPTNQAGVANAVDDCWGVDFWIDAAPESVQIAVASLDGSWIGSVNESPDYVRVSRCPGGTELCPPFAVVAIKPR